jgi:adenylate cyclase class IV
MVQEIEARFLEIDMKDLRKRLKKIGAKRIHDMRLYRRQMFELCGSYMKGYARVRDENGTITATVKTYPKGQKYANEYEVALGAGTTFEESISFMESTGLKKIAYHETIREKWKTKDGVEVTFDIIPGLPAYTEIEAKGEKQMKDISEKLGFHMKDATYGAYGLLFEHYYGFSEEVFNKGLTEVKFNTIDKVLRKFAKKNKDLIPKVKRDNLVYYKKATH